ncbi:MAG: hypothetical protein FJ267_01475 [Planctomycetes bacterium]|nr:hypothetical protein [Planctomycetota bacterium]
MNFYLATSRDGDRWDLTWVYQGKPIIPRGPDGAFDKDLLLPSSTVVTHEDQHWLYYSGANERHGTPEHQFQRTSAIGLAKLRLDGFVALTAGNSGGTVTTKPFRLDGNAIEFNVDAHDGEIRVDVLDESGKELSPFSGGNSGTGSRIDDVRWQPRWKYQDQLASLRNQTIRLRIHLQNARLYSFQVRQNK